MLLGVRGTSDVGDQSRGMSRKWRSWLDLRIGSLYGIRLQLLVTQGFWFQPETVQVRQRINSHSESKDFHG
jgi:hypothetical protein